MRSTLRAAIPAAILSLLAACSDGERGPAGADCTLRDGAIACEAGGGTPIDPEACAIEEAADGGQLLRCPDGSEHPIAQGPALEDGAIAGSVRRAGAGPEAGIRVSIPALDRTAETDEEGAFLLEALPAGRHDLRIEADGYPPRTIAGVLVARGVHVLPPIELRWGRLLEAGSHLLEVAPGEGHALLFEQGAFGATTGVRLADLATGASRWVAGRVNGGGFVGDDHYFVLRVEGGWELRAVEGDAIVASGEEPWVSTVGRALIVVEQTRVRILEPGKGGEQEVPGASIDTITDRWAVFYEPTEAGTRLHRYDGAQGTLIEAGIATSMWWEIDLRSGLLVWVGKDEEGRSSLQGLGADLPAIQLGRVTTVSAIDFAADADVLAWTADGRVYAHAWSAGGEAEDLGPSNGAPVRLSPTGRFVRFIRDGSSMLHDRVRDVVHDLGADGRREYAPSDRWVAWSRAGQLSILDAESGAIANRAGSVSILGWVGEPEKLLLAEGADLLLRDPASGQEIPLGGHREHRFSPDRRRIAFSTPADEIVVRDFTSGAERRIALEGHPRGFSGDGRHLLVYDDDGPAPPTSDRINLHLLDVDDGFLIPVDRRVTVVGVEREGFWYQSGGVGLLNLGGVEDPSIAVRWGVFP